MLAAGARVIWAAFVGGEVAAIHTCLEAVAKAARAPGDIVKDGDAGRSFCLGELRVGFVYELQELECVQMY
jgi:hypothetical protein